jgi:hypothetical protein
MAYVVNGLHGEVEGHELADRLEAAEGGADRNAREPGLRDGRVQDAVRPKLVQEVARNLTASNKGARRVIIVVLFQQKGYKKSAIFVCCRAQMTDLLHFFPGRLTNGIKRQQTDQEMAQRKVRPIRSTHVPPKLGLLHTL